MLFDETAISTLKTVRDVWRWGATSLINADVYFGHGTDNAWDESMALLMHVLRLPHDDRMALMWDARLTEAEKKSVMHLLKRRIEERVPLPYLTHDAFFAGLSFYVDERVLIPRSPCAEWIEKQFSPWIDVERVHRILDLCTGSGCIGIACAYYFPEADVVLSDISSDALTVAQKNIEKHEGGDQIVAVESDLFLNLSTDTTEKFDVIISNPPYVPVDEYKTLPKEYEHEPALALSVEADGLLIVDRILKSAGHYLNDGGILLLEVGETRDAFVERYPTLPVVWLECERGGEGLLLINKADLCDEFSTL